MQKLRILVMQEYFFFSLFFPLMMDLIFMTKGSVEKVWVFEAKTCVLIQAPLVNACMTLSKLLNTDEL